MSNRTSIKNPTPHAVTQTGTSATTPGGSNAVSPMDEMPRVKILPEKRKLTEQEKHEGWIENLRNEERTMKE